jgi:very-short-patch-repair endonuclease
MEGARRPIGDPIDLCQSDFERVVFRRLANERYRVTPQVQVGGYTIDLVVEGSEDRRLAIELDGDKYHGPERWMEDAQRQRNLERVGWRFWRCWGSSYLMDPEGCRDDLKQTLTSMDIEPLGSAVGPTMYTEHRIAKPKVPEAEALFEPEQRELAATEYWAAETTGEPRPPPAGEAPPQPHLPRLDMGVIEAAPRTVSAGPTESVPVVPSPPPPAVKEPLIEPGDRVLISYNDEPTRQLTITISERQHDPDMGIIRATQPLAEALMGYGENEEVEIPAGGGSRSVTILRIEKSESSRRREAAMAEPTARPALEPNAVPDTDTAPSATVAEPPPSVGQEEPRVRVGAPLGAVETAARSHGPDAAMLLGVSSYTCWTRRQLPDPRTASPMEVMPGLKEIIAAEGPVLCGVPIRSIRARRE